MCVRARTCMRAEQSEQQVGHNYEEQATARDVIVHMDDSDQRVSLSSII